MDDVLGHPDSARGPVPARRDHRHTGAQDPCDRAGCRRRLRRQARRDPGGVDRVRGVHKGRSSGEVHRDPVGVHPLCAPRPGRDPGHHPDRPPGRHGHRPEGEPHRQHGRLPGHRHARAYRSSARSCTTRSTSSRPTASSARESSPTRRRPMPIAAPDGRKRRMPSSASWTSSQPNSAWTRWRFGGRTGSATRSSRSPQWPGSSTTQATTRRPPTRRWSCSGTTPFAPSRPPGGPRTTRFSWASASRPTPRCAASPRPGSSARSSTAPAAGSR